MKLFAFILRSVVVAIAISHPAYAATFTKHANAQAYDFANPVVSASVTPTSGSAAMIVLARTFGNGGIGSPPSMSGMGLTWTLIGSANVDGDLDDFLFRGVGTASAGALTLSGGAFSGAAFYGIEITSANVAAPNLQQSRITGTLTTVSASISAFEDSANTPLLMIVQGGGTNTLDGSGDGYTVLTGFDGLFGGSRMYGAYGAANDNSMNISYVSGSGNWYGWLLEVDQAASGGGSALPKIMQQAANDPLFDARQVAQALR